MSAYQSDTFNFRGSWYELIEGGAFCPRDYGIGPYDADSYTPLGYQVSYGLIDKQLNLLDLYTNHDPDDVVLLQTAQAEPQIEQASNHEPVADDLLDMLVTSRRRRVPPPPLNQVEASPVSGNFWCYTNVNLPLNYTGTLVIDRMPSITGDESEHYIRAAIKDIVASGSDITRWSLQFDNGILIGEIAHEPDEQLAELIACYGSNAASEFDAFAPFDANNTAELKMDLEPLAPLQDVSAEDDGLFADFAIEPPKPPVA